MIIERWYQLVDSMEIPAPLPAWSGELLLPLLILGGYWFITAIVPYLTPASARDAFRLVVKRTRFPIQLLLLLPIASTFLTRLGVAADRLSPTIPLITVAASALLAYRLTGTLFVALRARFDISKPNNLSARRVVTQIVILERVVGFTIIVIAFAAGLTSIPEVRQWGASILASAGIISLLLGFAAQQTIANVLAGIQIAVTQPLRIDDTVVIDGEWGWVEEITLTYVVVRLWDKRRLIVPIAYLLQKPFQNWTRSTASIIGSVYLHADYSVNIDALRLEQTRTLAASELWDGEVDLIQVTAATERTVELRSLVSAANSSNAWDLRCLVRERLISHLRDEQPGALPRERLRLQGTIVQRDAEP